MVCRIIMLWICALLFIYAVHSQHLAKSKLRRICQSAAVIMVMLCVVLAAAFITLQLLPTGKDDKQYIYASDTILLGKVDPFWYQSFTVSRERDSVDTSLQLYLVQCDRLRVTERHRSYRSPILCPNDKFIVFNSSYLLRGSTVNINVTVLNVSTLSAGVELYIFDDSSKFFDFLDGKVPKHDSVKHEVVMTAGDQPISTFIDFQASKTSYYFAGICVTDPVTVQYQYEMRQLIYDRHDYSQLNCVVEDSTSCSVSIQRDHGLKINPEEFCILAYASPPPDEVVPYFDIVITQQRARWNLLLICVISALGVATLGVVLCACCCCYCYCKKRNHVSYVSLSNNMK